MPDPRLPAATSVGPVHLAVPDADRAAAFYRTAVGLRVRGATADGLRMGTADRDLVVLHGDAGLRRYVGTSGLFHLALLHPSRRALGHTVRRIVDAGGRLTGASDHLVSEAVYLHDVDGNGIEVYHDRPAEAWPREPDGRLRMGALPLDLDGLVRDADAAGPAGAEIDGGTVMGHVHLHVGDLDAARAFYVGSVGLDVMADWGGQAAFLAAGGYHHHLGINVWNGVGAPPAPADAVGLRSWTLVLPDAGAVDDVRARLAAAGADVGPAGDGLRVHDPSGNAVDVVAG